MCQCINRSLVITYILCIWSSQPKFTAESFLEIPREAVSSIFELDCILKAFAAKKLFKWKLLYERTWLKEFNTALKCHLITKGREMFLFFMIWLAGGDCFGLGSRSGEKSSYNSPHCPSVFPSNRDGGRSMLNEELEKTIVAPMSCNSNVTIKSVLVMCRTEFLYGG